MSASALTVERPVTIAVAGTHSTGKSTFLAHLAHTLRDHDLEVATVADLGELALQIGLPILHSHTYASTLWIMTQGISNEIATWAHVDVTLIDRPVPDALGYYLAALAYRGEEPDPAALDHLRSLAAQHSVNYDLVYRTALDHRVPLGTDKPRDRDVRFRALADGHVAAVLTDLDIPHRLLPSDHHHSEIATATRYALHRLADLSAPAAVSRRPDDTSSDPTASTSGGIHAVPETTSPTHHATSFDHHRDSDGERPRRAHASDRS